ncbi:TVP38/TMEM64 family protein [Paenibacillus sp. GCM10012303]|uniref:TVP38/TMEM64 family protein n=1 Tax=Paenibacillus sp. GCM10012303 TaxID=3317340 RepID=UPI00360922AD
MVKKWILAIVYIGAALAIYRYGESIMDGFRQSDQVMLVLIMATVMALFPVIPYPIVGGVIGAAFGPITGAGITWVGSATASLLMFVFVRYGYQEWGMRMLRRYSGIEKVTLLFERNAFLAILFARLLPFVPSFAINIYSALSRVSVAVYVTASSVGKIPAMLLFALVGDSLMSDPGNIAAAIGVYAVFLAVTLGLYRLWHKRKEQVGEQL